MDSSDYESLLLTLREQFEDEKTLDEIDINYLFEIIDVLNQKQKRMGKLLGRADI